MPDVLVLGGGLVGSVIAATLAQENDVNVTLGDRSRDALDRAAARASGSIETIVADLADREKLRKLLSRCDLAVGALPGSLGFQALETAIEVGRNYCDISFMPEDPLELDERAQAAGVTAIVDMGVAPGMSNMIAGYAAQQFERCERIDIFVGGLPRIRSLPFEYKAPFSPADVIEEYTRPARLVEAGQVVVRDALSEPEPLEIDGLGTLEAFNTDGLRSLIHTLDVPFMREKTLRYPGHAALMRAFREAGLFDTTPIEIGGSTVRPRDVFAHQVFPRWRYDEGEEDVTVMKIIASGVRGKEQKCLMWTLFDEYDHEANISSMARTTAYPCVVAARALLRQELSSSGVMVPETLGREPGRLQWMLAKLEEFDIAFQEHEI